MQNEITVKPVISIIILNWNNWKDTLECLNSVFQMNYPSTSIILVDNNSTDGSIKQIKDFTRRIPLETVELSEDEINKSNSEKIGIFKKEIYQKFKNDIHQKFILIKNNENRGFAGGNNVGINFALEYLDPDYILLLNNDTTVDEDLLHELLEVAGNNHLVGSIQPVLLNHDASSIDSLGQECYSWGAEDICMGYPLNDHKGFSDKEIFGSCAAAALYSSEVLRKTGLFDEDFFVELEDVDLSWKIRLHGYNSFLAGKSRVYHKRGVSGSLSSMDLIKGVKDEPIIRKWHRQSKNWLVIVIRYYPGSVIVRAVFRYPHKVFFTFFRLIYSSILLGKTRKTCKILRDNLKVRKKVQNNRLWEQIWQKWIKTSPTKCGNMVDDS